MNLKKLLPLVVVLVVLLAVNYAMRMQHAPKDIVQQANLKSLVPEKLSAADITKLEIYTGAKPDDKLVLVRKEGGKWEVSSHFNAPVREDKIDEFLKSLTDLRGEFRAKAEGDAQLADYGLTDSSAFHVVGYGKGDSPAFHVLVGKAPSPSTVFMRDDGSNDVFVDNTNIRQTAGIYGDDETKTPEATPWIDTTIVELNKDNVSRVALTMPDKKLTLARTVKEPAPDAKKDDATAGATPPEEKKPDYEWTVAEGGPGVPLVQTGVDSLLRALSALKGSNIVDPAKKAEWGLDAPTYTCVVTVEGTEEPTTIEGARPDPSGSGYIQIAGQKDGFIYEVSKYTFEQLFPRGGSLFQLPQVAMTADDIDKVAIDESGQKILLSKSDKAWQIDQPKADLEVQQPSIQGMVAALASWKPIDYADADAVPDMKTDRSVVFSSKDAAHAIDVDGPSKHVEGAYVKLDSGNLILVMSKTDLDRVFIAPKNLYVLSLLDVAEPDIESIAETQGDTSYQLKRSGDGGWSLAYDGAEAPADKDKADDLASALAELQAQDVLFGEAPPTGTPTAQIVITTGSGDTHTVTLEAPNADGAVPATVSGSKQGFLISADDAKALTPAPGDLKRPEPKPEAAPTAETPTPEGGVPAPVAEPKLNTPGAVIAPAPSGSTPESPQAAPIVVKPVQESPVPPKQESAPAPKANE